MSAPGPRTATPAFDDSKKVVILSFTSALTATRSFAVTVIYSSTKPFAPAPAVSAATVAMYQTGPNRETALDEQQMPTTDLIVLPVR